MARRDATRPAPERTSQRHSIDLCKSRTRSSRVPFVEMTRRDVDKLQEEIEELFADLWQVPRFSGMRHGFRPNVDCFHTDDPHVLTVIVELPGVDPRSVKIVANERLLVVAGERKRPKVPGRVY